MCKSILLWFFLHWNLIFSNYLNESAVDYCINCFSLFTLSSLDKLFALLNAQTNLLLLRDKQVDHFDRQTGCPFWLAKQIALFEGQTGCPFWGTNQLPFLRDKQLPFWQTSCMPFLRDGMVPDTGSSALESTHTQTQFHWFNTLLSHDLITTAMKFDLGSGCYGMMTLDLMTLTEI